MTHTEKDDLVEIKLTGLKDVVAWLECQPQWSGVAVRRVDDPPIPGEPFISMESAKHLVISAVSIMDNRRFDTKDGLVERLKRHKPYNELVDGPLVREAATRITALELELAEAREALKPFAAVSLETNCNDGRPLRDACETALACGINLLVRDLRRAARAYETKG